MMGGQVSGTSALVEAARWVQAVLLGNVAVAIAIIAVAALGLMLMSGRIDVRRAMVTLLGFFILFGAPVIASGLLRAADAAGAAEPSASVPSAVPRPFPAPSPSSIYDPYAGASVPQIR